MPIVRQILHDNFPKTLHREKVITFYYLYTARCADIRNRLHKKTIKELDYIVIPVKLAKMVFGRSYLQYFNQMVDLGLLEPVEIGTNEFGFHTIAFQPITKKLRCIASDKPLKDDAIYIYDMYLDEHGKDDPMVRILKNSIARTTYKGAPMRNVVHKDNFAGRYYHYLTNIPNRQRLRHTLIDGENVVELDIEQCQIKILQSVLENMGMGENFTRWMDDGNGLYEYIQDQHNIATRKEAKQFVFKMIFGDYNSKSSKLMYEIFPDLEEPFFKIKSVKDPANPSRKIFSNLARMLQLHEVEMLKDLGNMLDLMDIPFLSIHDSVLVKQSDFVRTESIFKQIAKQYIKDPNIKSKQIVYETRTEMELV